MVSHSCLCPANSALLNRYFLYQPLGLLCHLFNKLQGLMALPTCQLSYYDFYYRMTCKSSNTLWRISLIHSIWIQASLHCFFFFSSGFQVEALLLSILLACIHPQEGLSQIASGEASFQPYPPTAQYPWEELFVTMLFVQRTGHCHLNT